MNQFQMLMDSYDEAGVQRPDVDGMTPMGVPVFARGYKPPAQGSRFQLIPPGGSMERDKQPPPPEHVQEYYHQGTLDMPPVQVSPSPLIDLQDKRDPKIIDVPPSRMNRQET